MVLFKTSTDDVTFQFIENQIIESKFQLENVTTVPIAFKIKCTNPNTFQVKPNKGVLRQNEQITVTFILEPSLLKDAQKVVNEKFQVKAYPIQENLNPQQIEEQWKLVQSNKIQQQKMKIEMFQIIDGRRKFFENNAGPGQSYLQGSGIGSTSMYYSTMGGVKDSKFINSLNQTSEQRKQFEDLGVQYENVCKEHKQIEQERTELYIKSLQSQNKGKGKLDKIKELTLFLAAGIVIGYFAI